MTIQIRNPAEPLAALCLSVLFGAASALGATFSTNATTDALVTTGPSGNLASNNYGGAGALSLAAPGLPQGELQSVLQFNLGGAVGGFNTQFGAGQWSIQSVTSKASVGSILAAAWGDPQRADVRWQTGSCLWIIRTVVRAKPQQRCGRKRASHHKVTGWLFCPVRVR